ncbi:phage tail protein [Candidatus Symbiopectobacterium sp. NZEC135]|uniref:phage tail protein n=1 Tax=Candidatus Symbiopectobacterium sp. NZEC135 TaxID=2820471 RepID=UPI002225C4CE|nr:phage tail protein [Candidatus Symbiopectobacterium sp. NZEC135]MCW2482196.1 phage tail protein [Candidatus Symbiopectobacterium sp. NZEC135]
MSQLEALTDFVTQNLPRRVMQGFDSFMDEISFICAQRDLGEGQYQLAVMQFDAVLSWERWPYREFDPKNLCALLLVWQTEQDEQPFMDAGLDRELPTLDVDVIDRDTATVVVSVKGASSLTIIEDDNGIIPFDGKRWRLADPEIWFASEASVYGADETGAPIGQTT